MHLVPNGRHDKAEFLLPPPDDDNLPVETASATDANTKVPATNTPNPVNPKQSNNGGQKDVKATDAKLPPEADDNKTSKDVSVDMSSPTHASRPPKDTSKATVDDTNPKAPPEEVTSHDKTNNPTIPSDEATAYAIHAAAGVSSEHTIMPHGTSNAKDLQSLADDFTVEQLQHLLAVKTKEKQQKEEANTSMQPSTNDRLSQIISESNKYSKSIEQEQEEEENNHGGRRYLFEPSTLPNEIKSIHNERERREMFKTYVSNYHDTQNTNLNYPPSHSHQYHRTIPQHNRSQREYENEYLYDNNSYHSESERSTSDDIKYMMSMIQGVSNKISNIQSEVRDAVSNIQSEVHDANLKNEETFDNVFYKLQQLQNEPTPPSPNNLASSSSESVTQSTGRSNYHTAFVDPPLFPRQEFEYDGETYQTKELLWKPCQTGYLKILKNDLQGVIPTAEQVTVMKMLTQKPPTYQTSQHPHTDDDLRDVKHCQLFELKQVPEKVSALQITSFRADRFIKALETLKLGGDGLSDIREFYDEICMRAKTAHVSSQDVLPSFVTLVHDKTIKQMMQGPPNSYYEQRTMAFITFVSGLLRNFLMDKGDTTVTISRQTSPIAYMHLTLCQSQDGLEILDYILKQMVPKLGARSIDTNQLIADLKIKNGITLADFLVQAVELERTVKNSEQVVGTNAIITKILQQLQRCSNIDVTDLNRKFTQHQRTSPNCEFVTYASAYVLKYMNDSGIDLQQTLITNHQQRSLSHNNSTNYQQRRFSRALNHRSNHRNQQDTPRVNVIQTLDQDETQQSIYDEQEDDDQYLTEEEEVEFREELIQYAMEHPALVNAILDNEEQQRGPCGICNQRHATLRCFLLRPGNIPVVLRRRIEQFRLKLKSEIEKLDKADKERGDNAKASKTPVPPKANLSFAKPAVSTISSDVAQDFNKQVEQATSTLQNESHEPYQLSSQEKVDIQDITTLLENTVGDIEPSTPIPPVVAAAATQDLLVDFNQEKSVYIPIHADYESELNPSDYDAYNDTVNW